MSPVQSVYSHLLEKGGLVSTIFFRCERCCFFSPQPFAFLFHFSQKRTALCARYDEKTRRDALHNRPKTFSRAKDARRHWLSVGGTVTCSPTKGASLCHLYPSFPKACDMGVLGGVFNESPHFACLQSRSIDWALQLPKRKTHEASVERRQEIDFEEWRSFANKWAKVIAASSKAKEVKLTAERSQQPACLCMTQVRDCKYVLKSLETAGVSPFSTNPEIRGCWREDVSTFRDLSFHLQLSCEAFASWPVNKLRLFCWSELTCPGALFSYILATQMVMSYSHLPALSPHADKCLLKLRKKFSGWKLRFLKRSFVPKDGSYTTLHFFFRN